MAGAGSTDNAAFSISGNTLQIAASPNFEAQPSYAIRVRTTDQGGLTFERLHDQRDQPERDAHRPRPLAQRDQRERGRRHDGGHLQLHRSGHRHTFTYSLVAGAGSTDNAAFSISGNTLQIAASPNFEAQSSYAIRVRTTDQGGLTFERQFTITVADLNEAPTLGNGTLASVPENTASPAGQTVATIFAGQFADVDSGSSFGGIAVVGNTASAGTEGVWQYYEQRRHQLVRHRHGRRRSHGARALHHDARALRAGRRL